MWLDFKYSSSTFDLTSNVPLSLILMNVTSFQIVNSKHAILKTVLRKTLDKVWEANLNMIIILM